MASYSILIIEDVFEYDDAETPAEDARVMVIGEEVVIQPHDSDQEFRLRFTRDEWLEVSEFVRVGLQPTTTGGRE